MPIKTFFNTRPWLVAECIIVTLVIPALLFVWGNNRNMVVALWGMGALTYWWLRRHVSWAELWHGAWLGTHAPRKFLWLLAGKTLLVALSMVALCLYVAPEKFFGFPSERPALYATVMLLYPLLSVLPQEVIYRSFFMRRYDSIARPLWLLAFAAIAFGYSHLMFNNWIAPVLSLLGGVLIGQSYLQHRSLKWAVIEHTLYGWIVFTVGLGWFFYLGAWRPASYTFSAAGPVFQ